MALDNARAFALRVQPFCVAADKAIGPRSLETGSGLISGFILFSGFNLNAPEPERGEQRTPDQATGHTRGSERDRLS